MRTEFHTMLLSKLKDVGEPRFNLAHEKLFNIIIDADEILGAAATGERQLTEEEWNALSSASDDLAAYTKVHFAEEEAFLVARSYPESDRHRATHLGLVEELNNFQKKVAQRDEQDLKEMRRWLLEWLLSHINHEDYAYAQHFFGKQ
ncbi:MAG: hemerythrin domain-containing protein [Magnetococcales bacterium]|nr:hemerythrin domain-containing protein [Magnetococcales bacterium]